MNPRSCTSRTILHRYQLLQHNINTNATYTNIITSLQHQAPHHNSPHVHGDKCGAMSLRHTSFTRTTANVVLLLQTTTSRFHSTSTLGCTQPVQAKHNSHEDDTGNHTVLSPSNPTTSSSNSDTPTILDYYAKHLHLRSTSSSSASCACPSLPFLSSPCFVLGLDINTSSTGYALINHRGHYVDAGIIRLHKYGTIIEKTMVIGKKLSELKQQYICNTTSASTASSPSTDTNPQPLCLGVDEAFSQCTLCTDKTPSSITSTPSNDVSEFKAKNNSIHINTTPSSEACDTNMSEHASDLPCYIVIEDYLRMYGNHRFNVTHLFKLAEINAMTTLLAKQILQSSSSSSLTPCKLHPSIARKTFQLKIDKHEKNTCSNTNEKQNGIKHVVYDFVKPLFPSTFQWPMKVRHRSIDYNHAYDISDAMLIAHAKLYQVYEADRESQRRKEAEESELSIAVTDDTKHEEDIRETGIRSTVSKPLMSRAKNEKYNLRGTL